MLAVALYALCLAGWPRIAGAASANASGNALGNSGVNANADAAGKAATAHHANAAAGSGPGGDAHHNAAAASSGGTSASASTIADAPAPRGKNLLVNGDLSHGSGDAPDGWRHDGWIQTPDTTTFKWIPPRSSQPGELEVETHRDNDARWVQTLSMQPGWYYFSAETSARNVLPFKTGANISLLEDNIVSDNVRGTGGWQRLGFYLKVGKYGADVDFALRLGGYMNVTRGDVFFREPSVVKVIAPPPGARYVYDLEETRRSEAAGPIGRLWTLIATAAVFVLLGTLGWWMYGGMRPVMALGESGRSNAVKSDPDEATRRGTTQGRSRR